MNRTDVAHLFRWVYPPQKSRQKIKKRVSVGHFQVYSEIRVEYFGKIDLKWVAVARFGLKMGGNESHKVQDHF